MGIRDFLLNGPLGFGTAPLGNMFRDIPDHEAEATVDAAWDQGTRFSTRHRCTAPAGGDPLRQVPRPTRPR
jgi:D-threo-aldose 1-dehydrogenase